jgi:hypothetical protein
VLASLLYIQLTTGMYIQITDTHVLYESGHEQLEE